MLKLKHANEHGADRRSYMRKSNNGNFGDDIVDECNANCAKKANKRKHDMTTDVGKAEKRAFVSPIDVKYASLYVSDISNGSGLASQTSSTEEADLLSSIAGYGSIFKPVEVGEKPSKSCVDDDQLQQKRSSSQKEKVEEIGFGKRL